MNVTRDGVGGRPGGPAPSDEELVSAFVAGDQTAFDELVSRYQRRVYAICFRYFGHPADAEDAAQDAFLALLRRAETFSGSASFSTWMYRVATNACNDLARKRARRPQRVDEDVSGSEDLAVGAGVEEALAERGLPEDLVEALRSLDSDTREAVVLHDVYGFPYAEIADSSGVAVGTIKSRIHRGHARLAAALGPRPEPSDPTRPPTARP